MSTSMNRRAVLAGAATLPTISISALAASPEPDPIYAAIEAHRAAWATLGANCRRLDQADTPEAEAELDSLNDGVDDAEDALCDTAPTTLAGAVAVLRYVAEHREQSGDDEFAGGMLLTLADALESMTAAA